MDYSNKYNKAWLNKFQGIQYLRYLEPPVDSRIQSKMQNSITCLSESQAISPGEMEERGEKTFFFALSQNNFPLYLWHISLLLTPFQWYTLAFLPWKALEGLSKLEERIIYNICLPKNINKGDVWLFVLVNLIIKQMELCYMYIFQKR